MSYYNTPERPIDPPQMSKEHENILDAADELISKIEKLHDKAETFFEELTLSQLEDIFGDVEYYLDELYNLSTDNFILEDEYNAGKWMLEEIEGWVHEKEDSIKDEDK